MIIAALFAAALALADRPAAAVPAADQGAYKAWLADQAIEAEATFSLKDRCADAAVRDAATQVITVRGAPSGMRSQGLSESVIVEGCGRRMRVNLNVLAPLSGQAWLGRAGLPGESLASVGLQQEAAGQLPEVLKARRAAGCESLLVGEAQVAARPGNVRFLAAGTPFPKGPPGMFYMALDDPAQAAQLAEAQAWAERWSLTACGLDVSVSVLFAPLRDQSTTAILISPAWAEKAAGR